jgi:hypothetical protein
MISRLERMNLEILGHGFCVEHAQIGKLWETFHGCDLGDMAFFLKMKFPDFLLWPISPIGYQIKFETILSRSDQ